MMKEEHQYFTQLRKATLIIQSKIKKWLAERHTVKERLRIYTGDRELAAQKVKIIESNNLYPYAESSPKFPTQIDKSYGVSKIDMMGMGTISSPQKQMGMFQCLKPFSPFEPQKISLFALPIDMHIMADISEIYNPPWSFQWNSLFKEGKYTHGDGAERVNLAMVL